jgi:hypothetical protein
VLHALIAIMLVKDPEFPTLRQQHLTEVVTLGARRSVRTTSAVTVDRPGCGCVDASRKRVPQRPGPLCERGRRRAGLRAYPFPVDKRRARPRRPRATAPVRPFTYAHAGLWFSSSFFLASIGFSCLYNLRRPQSPRGNGGAPPAVSHRGPA